MVHNQIKIVSHGFFDCSEIICQNFFIISSSCKNYQCEKLKHWELFSQEKSGQTKEYFHTNSVWRDEINLRWSEKYGANEVKTYENGN